MSCPHTAWTCPSTGAIANWRPMLADTLRRMQADGVRNALAFATSAFGSYSGCRQYREDIERAREAVGTGAPKIDKLPPFHNRPGFLTAMADRVRTALGAIPAERRASAVLLYTAHSIPLSMAESSPYVAQLQESCGLVSKAVGHPGSLVYQSRSGPPTQPWLEPDVCDRIRQLHAGGGAHRSGAGAYRVPLRPYGSGIRSGYRSRQSMPRTLGQPGACRYRGSAPCIHFYDSGSDRGV